MNGLNVFARLCCATALAAGALFVPSVAGAQDVPSYALPAAASADETIHGRIRSVDGAFTMTVDDDRGFVDEVELHGGTIINPMGLTLSPGMSVTILGYNAGSAFDANEIDTPYSYDGPLPTPVYYGAGYWCPGFAYGYGPSFALAIVFGGGGGPWHYEHRPYYGRPWNGAAYFGHAVSFAPDARRRIEAQHVPAAFEQRHFAGEERFSSESNAAVRASGGPAAAGGYRRTETNGFAGRSAQSTRTFGSSDGARNYGSSAREAEARSYAPRSYGAAEGHAASVREPQAARGASGSVGGGGRSEGGHAEVGHGGGSGHGEGGGRGR